MIYCQCGGDTKVITTITQPDGVVRRRTCVLCGARSLTIERLHDALLDAPIERAPRRASAGARSARPTPAKPVASFAAVQSISEERIERNRESRHRVEDLRNERRAAEGWP